VTLPSLEGLRCFVAAARLLNFRLAARAVALSPGALGKRIQQLEEQVGVRLFERTTRHAALTEAGFAMLPWAERALDAAQSGLRAGRGELGRPPLDLTLGTRHELGMSWIVPMLAPLREALPWLTLHVYIGAGPDLDLRVRSREIDCAVSSRPIRDPTLDFETLHREDYVFVASPALLTRLPLREAADAPSHTLLDVHADLPLFQYWQSSAEGMERLRFGKVLRLGTIEAIRALVLASQGVAVLPRYLVEPDLRASAMTPLFPTVEPQHDWFRLFFRADDPRRSVYAALAAHMRGVPLR
jgi:DNA-binding transcriptional LysR family regulator